MAASSIHGTGAQNMAKARSQAGGVVSAIVLPPVSASRARAVAVVRPGGSEETGMRERS